MSAQLRLPMILAAAFCAVAAQPAFAADMATDTSTGGSMGATAGTQPMADPTQLQVPGQEQGQPAMQVTVGPVGQTAGQAPASAQQAGEQPANPEPDANSLDDEEAPAVSGADTPQVPPGDAAVTAADQNSGPKTATDKLVDHFMELDTDGSDSVSMAEYVAMVQKRMEARFAAMDANGDGQVTPEEYREFWKSRMAHWYRLKR